MSLDGQDAMDEATALDPPIASMSFQAAPPPLFPLQRKRRQRPRPDYREALGCHEELVRLEAIRPRYLSDQVQCAVQEQGRTMLLIQKSMAETRAVESYLQHLCTAQQELIKDLKVPFPYDGADGDTDDVSVLTECQPEQSSMTSTAVTIATTTMNKSTRLMVHKLYTLGVKQLQQVLGLVRRFRKGLQEQRDDLERLEQTAVLLLEETGCQVRQAWEKYFSDASAWIEKEDDSPTSNPNHKIPSGSTTLTKTSSGNHLHTMGRRRSLVSSRNNSSLRTMNKAATMTANVRDVWLSEWSYRAHLLEQDRSCRDACDKLRQMCSAIHSHEVKRRTQLRDVLIAVAKSQQRLAVNLQAASTWSLMEYVEGKHQEVIEEEEDNKGLYNENDPLATRPTFMFESMTPRGSDSSMNISLELPSLMESGFLTLVTVVKRKETDGSRSTVSLLIVTTDGIMFFFDVPNDETTTAAMCENLRKVSVAQVYQSILKAASKRQFGGAAAAAAAAAEEQMEEKNDLETRVAPPMPSLRFVMSQCSVEMTSEDCVVQFCIPESLGKDFLIQLPSTRMEIGFIDNFHACKFQVDSMTDLVATDNEAGDDDDDEDNLSGDDYDTSSMDDDDDPSFSED